MKFNSQEEKLGFYKEKLEYEEYIVLNENHDKEILNNFAIDKIESYKQFSGMYLAKEEHESNIIIYNKNNIEIEYCKDYFKLLETLTKIKEENPDSIVFRGHSNANYQLASSLIRMERDIENEDRDYFDIIKAYPQKFRNARYHLDYLKTIQHYGGKTRIIDVTTNFLVAMYFALSGNKNAVGEVVIFDKSIDDDFAKDNPRYNTKVKRLNSDTVEILSSLAALDFDSKESVKSHAHTYANLIKDYPKTEIDLIKQFNSHRDVKRLVHEVGQVRLNFSHEIDPTHLLEIYFSDSTFDNERITNQAGEFIIHGLIPKTQVMKKLNIYRYKEKKRKIILIDNEKRGEMKRYLSLFGIKDNTIYPSLENAINEIQSKRN
ncbi:FRG domain-containing protein [Salinicoccus roseus]|uniref:FRG domain-containing protein n=1 Tax=Salinicoccus roseus TaxID=45670 RepID=UPI0023015BBC|nr:FRG domain-containing protein [Salinicoccus roseus]